jgi:hypothetical protein
MTKTEYNELCKQSLGTLAAEAYLRSKGKLKHRPKGVLTLCNRAIIARCGSSSNDLPPLTVKSL